MTKWPQCGGLNDPANTTVPRLSFLRSREVSGGIAHGYESMVGKMIRKMSIPIAMTTVETRATGIAMMENESIREENVMLSS